ncbi:hypothetical protein WDW89_16975 [Deltaproteobacteria bacterium TL4]
MKISFQAILSVSIFILGMALSYSLGSLAGNLIRQQILALPQPVLRPPVTQKTVPIQDKTLPESQFKLILDKNIFNATRAEVDKPVSENASSATVVSAPQLNISLVGTMIYSPNTSFAFFSQKGKESEYEVFQKGECFAAKDLKRIEETCEPQYLYLNQIRNREVSLIYQNKEEILKMEAPKEETLDRLSEVTEKGAPPSPLPIKPPQAVVKNTPPVTDPDATPGGEKTTFHYTREWVNEQLANFSQILRDARVVPTIKEGKTYFSFKYIKAESLYEKLGLIKNDIILEINGFPIDNITKALSLLETLKSEQEIVLKVERNKVEKEFRYYID